MKIKNIMAVGLSFVRFGKLLERQPAGECGRSERCYAGHQGESLCSGSSLKVGGDENALEGETNINNIAVLSFTPDGSQILADPYWTDGMSASGGEATY